MSKLYEVSGTISYSVECVIQADNEADAISYFEDYAAFELIDSAAGGEYVEVDDVFEVKSEELIEPDFITMDGDDEDDEDDL